MSNYIILEQLAQARDQATWNALMAPALATLNCRVLQSTSDEASGLAAYVEQHLGAPHSPDVFHVQQALSKAVCAPMATTVRTAYKAVTEAHERLEQVQVSLQTAGDEPHERGPGRPPKATMSLEQAQQALETASREHERLAPQREQVTRRMRAIGHAYHVVDLERGVRRNGKRIAADIHEHIDTIRAVAHGENLSPTCLARIAKAERVVPKMQATVAFVSGDVREQVRQLDLTPLAAYSMHAPLIPSCSLERVAQTRTSKRRRAASGTGRASADAAV